MSMQQGGIAWATAAPGTALQPPIIQNPIFIRGGQPGQENLIFQGGQAHAMIPPTCKCIY